MVLALHEDHPFGGDSSNGQEMITGQFHRQDGRLTAWGIGPYQHGEQIKSRFVYEDDGVLLLFSLSFEFIKALLLPFLDRSLVTLGRTLPRFLLAVLERSQQTTRVTRVIADAYDLLDYGGHPLAGPDLTMKAEGLRSSGELLS